MIRVFRYCAGEYLVVGRTAGRPRAVRVVKVHYPQDGVYWIAAAERGNHTSDPLPTKRAAVEAAKQMLQEGDCR